VTTREPGETVPKFLIRLRQEAARADPNDERDTISQAEAADRAKVPRESWVHWEGRRKPGPKNRRKIAAAFDVNPDDLLSRPDEEAQTLASRLEVLIARGEELADRLDTLIPAVPAEDPNAESGRPR
jgi:transcriptional regulator with XRE-family HTH domain